MIRISDIPAPEWIALRDHLSGNGWTLEKGGGLDHAWARLQCGELVIDMEYDNWMEGEVCYAPEQAEAIEAMLPASILALGDG